ncbi:ATP-binding response regulator [Sediminispirochaeta smaragdinae]|uniref:histidine kinase n=1 Tax=Sediminispirochaeta smaragdinae (strain DSM 11293 / JCM 15392 / SEBR 4228) TaxID=573413 RepID=E1R715_SEDSS|nr:response regulator [Sediminispirochaeta smaragdinae]ADK81342.1 PAS/PAC sensor hybrid histidine kinase [Sediminispirochaeta smaragdinae DSM 11293]
MSELLRVLLVEDSDEDAELFQRVLQREGFELEITRAVNAKEFSAFIDQKKYDIVVSDFQLIDTNGFKILEIFNTRHLDIPFITVSGRVGEENAVRLMRKGARDYVMKDQLSRLAPVIRRELEEYRARRENEYFERKLKESEAKFSQVFRFSPDPVVITDDKLIIREINYSYLAMFGLMIDEVVGRKIDTLAMWEKHENFIHYLLKMHLGAHSPSTECNMTDAEGKERTIHWSLKSIQVNDEELLLWNGRDLTELKQLEGKLQQTERIHAIGTLAGGIAHDFNNILAVIYGYAEMGLSNSEGKPRFHRYFSEIIRSSDRAKELIKQILTFSRMEEGKRDIIDPAPIVKEALKMIRATIPSTVELKAHIESGHHILANISHIHQIILNLCTNAAYAMKKKPGTLRISLDSIENFCRLQVQDTGVGITPETMKRIFLPYFTTKDVNEGTGLGLSVVHGIVEKYKGSIDVASKPGEGTCFTILLPLSHGDDENNITDEEPNNTLSNIRTDQKILIVDDEPSIVNYLQELLSSSGISVDSETKSIEALKRFLSVPPQTYATVITDQSMPTMTGTELAYRLRKYDPAISFIFITGNEESIPESVIRDLGQGIILSKPVSSGDLLQTLRGFMS